MLRHSVAVETIAEVEHDAQKRSVELERRRLTSNAKSIRGEDRESLRLSRRSLVEEFRRNDVTEILNFFTFVLLWISGTILTATIVSTCYTNQQGL